jgi:hypothetical protein
VEDLVTDPTPQPGPANPWPSDAPAPAQDGPATPGPWASDYRSPVAPAASRPRTIATAVKLMYLGAGLTVLGVLLTILQIDAIRDSIEDSDSTLSDSEVDSLVAGSIAFIVVFSLVAVGLWLWMASANGKGRSWARVVASVLGGLSILWTLLGFLGGNATPLSLLVSVINLGLAGYILYLLWRPESTQFYEANTPR